MYYLALHLPPDKLSRRCEASDSDIGKSCIVLQQTYRRSRHAAHRNICPIDTSALLSSVTSFGVDCFTSSSPIRLGRTKLGMSAGACICRPI